VVEAAIPKQIDSADVSVTQKCFEVGFPLAGTSAVIKRSLATKIEPITTVKIYLKDLESVVF
jgi:hypothetical protein